MPEPLTRKQLYDLVWQKPMTKVAEEYGLSDRGLGKLCERYGVPVPPRGYWAKKSAGRKLTRPPLIDFNANVDELEILVQRTDVKAESKASSTVQEQAALPPEELRLAIENERLPQNSIKIQKTFNNAHPIVARWIEKEQREARESRSHFNSLLISTFEKRNKPLDLRRRRIINTLLKALEKRRFRVTQDDQYREIIAVAATHDCVTFEINERIRQFRKQLTDEDRKKSSFRDDRKWTQVREPTGELVLTIKCSRFYISNQSFKDQAELPLETQLNDIMIGIITALWEAKQARLVRQERERKELEEHIRRSEIERQKKEEKQRQELLIKQAGDWKTAALIREYVAAVCEAARAGRGKTEDELESWTKWALKQADDIDPIPQA